jgi:uncharacterized protein YerC
MTQISKYRMSQSVSDQITGFLFQTIANLKTKRQVSEFLNDFLTPVEKVMFSKRLAIGYLIAKDYNQRDISRVLKVSTTTVSTFYSVYKSSDSYKKMVDQIVIKVKNKEMFLDLAESVAELGAIGGAKSASWFTARNDIQKKKRELL